MYFKSLEIIGFKSFAEKTVLNFEPGVTAVVGPNGCGKSNIADAVRWVLGEQSAKSLRASSMQDVIFNGTETKEPINFAEVSLTFSNEKRILPIDYDEVTITRRLYRSGDTEYLLNKTPVRLKDISELLMGTGIGTESYSIIEQGKMDLILSSKPEDRRYVFEEASGITKYKSKKKEALRKLEQTEQNLLRINDIIQEVKRQISSIERQARKAEKYKVDFDKLKDLEVKLSFSEHKSLKTQEATHAVENGDVRNREKDLDEEIKTVASKISQERYSLDDINQKASDLKARQTEMTTTLGMNNHKCKINEERIEEARLLQEGIRKEIETIKEKITTGRNAVEKLKEELRAVASNSSEKRKSIEEMGLKCATLSKEIEDTEISVKTYKVQMVDYLAKETRIKNELIKIGADVQNRKGRQRRLVLEKGTVERELRDLASALNQVVAEYKDVENRLANLRAEGDAKKSAREALLLEIKALDIEISREENERSSVKSKVEILEDSLKRYEGFSRGVKNILVKALDRDELFNGIRGVLADMIKIEKGFEEAVNTFLGLDAQTVIVENDRDIVKAIDYLRDNKLGKASFLSLETINRIGPGTAKQSKDGLISLRNYIKIETGLEIILDYFFANAFVVESLEEGIEKIGKFNSVALVTRSGAMLKGCKISGGSASDSEESLLVGRRDRLEDLRIGLRRIEDKIVSLNITRNEKAMAQESLDSDISSYEGMIRREEISLENIKVKREGQEKDEAKIKEEMGLLGSELNEANQEIDELVKKGESLNAELNLIEKERTLKQSFIDNSQDVVTGKKSEREKATLETATLKVQVQSLEKDEENARNNLKAQETSVFELEDALYSKEGDLRESIEKAKALGDEISSLKAQSEGIIVNLNTVNEELSTIDAQKSNIIDGLSIDEVQLKTKDEERESLRNQARDLDVKLTELNYKRTNLRDRIFQSYKIDLENTHMEIEENIDWDSIRSQVVELKERLDKLGPVNLVAIDEHKELEERHAFLAHQQEDLTNAKDSLMKAIQKINKTTKELFIDAFQKIHVEFKNFFRMLFGGGQAELVLIDEQDILESGIEIIVRPPGKKLQNIMLLSGGEKALTAIALLFSIFKVKPSPFCVLDEIDAPLDESNINRFSNVLRDFLKISQFIIITHNKRTIELADVMYGITMQERGVSKIVSVKFLDSEKNLSAEKDVDAVPQRAA